MTPTREQLQALRALCDALLEAVGAAGTLGAPGGTLYAALIGRVSLGTFEQVMGALVRSGKLTKRGELYFTVQS